MPGLPKASAATALACLLLGLAACGGGGGGGSTSAPGNTAGDNPGNGSQQPPPPPVTVIGGTSIDLDTAFTGSPARREQEFDDREETAKRAEPGNNNVLLLDGDGEPYDTWTFFTIDGADATSNRSLTPKGEDYALSQVTRFVLNPPSGYTLKYWTGEWSVPELDDLDIRHNAGSELVIAFTDKSDANDTDYLEFGWWRLVDFETANSPAPDTKKMTVRYGAYGRATSSTATDLSGVTGTATYSGTAVGRWKKTSPDARAGAFRDATVSLTADFDASTIGGTVTNLRLPIIDGPVDDTWEITLAETGFDNQGVIAGGDTTTQDGSAAGGYWKGEFQLGEDSSGNAVQPPAVVGKFTAHFDDGSVVGAFAAKK